PPEPPPEPVGYSRAVGIVVILHMLIAASGLAFFIGMSSVMQEYGSDPISRYRSYFGVLWAIAWASAGIGILRRWPFASVFSLILICCSLLSAIFFRSICQMVLLVGMWIVLIVRRKEFL